MIRPRLQKLPSALLLAVLVAACGPQYGSQPQVDLTLLSTNDFHGNLEPTGAKYRDRPVGGAAFLATLIERERQADPDGTLLLDGGDIVQGTALSNLTQGRATIDFYNFARYDAAAIGNHEFDWGVPVLVDRIEQAKFPLLAANIVEKSTGRAPPWAKPYQVFTKKGLRIAVIGLITPDTPNVTLPQNVEPYRFLDPAEVANRLIRELVPSRADLAVIVTHIGGEQKEGEPVTGEIVELAEAVQGEAAIVGGHTHQAVAGDVGGVPIVEAGSNARFLGKIHLRVDRKSRRVLEGRAEILPVYNDELTADPEAEALIAGHAKAVEPRLAEVLGEAEVPLEAERRECPMGNFLSDLMRSTASADLAFQNPGGVRSPIDAGPIQYREVYRVMPFDNTIVVLEMTGAEVKQLLEQAADKVGFLHASGLRYAVDPNQPVGSRVTLRTPLEEARKYKVAVNNFMAQGGDGLTILANRPEARETGVVMREAMADFIRAETRAGRKISARVEGRVEMP
ncbi:MAG TPA: 5'-nucleotidase C-terminal domain-containing protein [Thermoanaerobaculia bacterium]|nr:5'-nucleotidase C-terminal domain-containing protein [Thermoanaerobaculia bacterium]